MANSDLADAIRSAAQRLGVSPVDLGTAISYETAGTFDPNIAGPKTQWGQHRGLLQWGEPQAQKYLGGDFSIPSQLNGAVSYLQDAGVKPGMGLMDIYSAINAGHVGRNNASDANNGGAPGTVADKVNDQMAAHRDKAAALVGAASLPDQPAQMAGSMAPQGMAAPPDMTTPVPNLTPSTPTDDKANKAYLSLLGSMAPKADQATRFSPVNIQGPSADQANGLLKLVQALKDRMAQNG